MFPLSDFLYTELQTLIPGYKFALLRAVCGVESNLPPPLQALTAVVPVPMTMAPLNKACLTIFNECHE